MIKLILITQDRNYNGTRLYEISRPLDRKLGKVVSNELPLIDSQEPFVISVGVPEGTF